MAKRKVPRTEGDVVPEQPALTAQSYAMVRSLKKAQRRLADYIARLMAGESAEVIGTNPPRSLALAVHQGHDISLHINKMLDTLESQI